MARHPMNMRTAKMSALGPALNEVLAEGGQLERGKSAVAAEIWPQIVGPWYARRSCVIALRKKELRIYCDTPAMAQQLQMDQELITARLNERLGGKYVTSLRPSSAGPREHRDTVRAQVALEPSGPDEAELAQIVVPPEELQAIRERAAQLESEPLRESFISAAEYWLRLEEWRRQRGYRECPECSRRHDELTELCYACRVMRGQPYLG
jgi:predicted nucleic acid-binding Zn ribbon protein